jgi:flagellar biosynthetic protein FlhB
MADSSKTEQATPQRRRKAREQGQVPRSRELSAALSTAAVAGVVYFMGRVAVPYWSRYFRSTLELAGQDSIEPGGALMFWTSVEAMRWVFPVLLAALAMSLLASFAQGGFVFAPATLAVKADRISPASRLQQMFSPVALSNILKSLLPFGAIVWIGYSCIRTRWNEILGSSFIDTHRFAGLMGSVLLELCWKSGLVLLAWAGVDYLFMWWKNEGDLKMSRQDIREELKQSEGSPENKARVRRIQRQMRRKQMLKATETATVVITNPTHYAVALRYEAHMAAPVVVAKGRDFLAAKIKEVARLRDIPIMENRPLAQALYKGVEVGDPIPAALYHAVAEILVLIYRAQAEIKNREAQRREPINPIPEVRPQ